MTKVVDAPTRPTAASVVTSAIAAQMDNHAARASGERSRCRLGEPSSSRASSCERVDLAMCEHDRGGGPCRAHTTTTLYESDCQMIRSDPTAIFRATHDERPLPLPTACGAAGAPSAATTT